MRSELALRVADSWLSKASSKLFQVIVASSQALVIRWTRGVPESIHREIGVEGALRLPMIPANRSINLSNAVAVMVFEAWRQCGFSGAV